MAGLSVRTTSRANVSILVDGDGQRAKIGMFDACPGEFDAVKNAQLNLVGGHLVRENVHVPSGHQFPADARLCLHHSAKGRHHGCQSRFGHIPEQAIHHANADAARIIVVRSGRVRRHQAAESCRDQDNGRKHSTLETGSRHRAP